MKKIIAGVLLLFSGLNLQAQLKGTGLPTTPPNVKMTYIRYADPKDKVSIKHPSTWVQTHFEVSFPLHGVFMFMRPVEERGQQFRENINLVTGDAQDLVLIEYLIDARKKMKEQMDDFKELKSEYIKINGVDFVRMIYHFRNAKLPIKSVLYLAVINNKAYSLTGTALDGTFDRFYPMFEKMAKSFRIY